MAVSITTINGNRMYSSYSSPQRPISQPLAQAALHERMPAAVIRSIRSKIELLSSGMYGYERRTRVRNVLVYNALYDICTPEERYWL